MNVSHNFSYMPFKSKFKFLVCVLHPSSFKIYPKYLLVVLSKPCSLTSPFFQFRAKIVYIIFYVCFENIVFYIY